MDRLSLPLLLLDDDRREPGDPGLLDDVLRAAGLPPRRPRIRCPRCRWEPRARDRWVCHPGCQHAWNTFDPSSSEA